MSLHAEVEGSGPRVVLLHGFTQTLRSWDPVAEDLAADHEVVRVDLPGHGGSSAEAAGLLATAELVADAGGRAVYVGYSMGGRVALGLAMVRPAAVAGLVLIGATAGIDDPAARRARRTADLALADRIEEIGTEAFLEEWLRQPLFADLDPTPVDLAARRANLPAGLAASLRLAGTGTMDPPWWSRLPSLTTAPTLVLAGERDEKFTALGLRLADGIGASARFEAVPGAGHAAHLERPALVAARIRRLVAGTNGDRARRGPQPGSRPR